MRTGIHVGAIIDKQSLEPLTEAITRIMQMPGDQKTIRAALALLGRVADTSNISINNSHVVGDSQHDHYHAAPEEHDANPVKAEDDGA